MLILKSLKIFELKRGDRFSTRRRCISEYIHRWENEISSNLITWPHFLRSQHTKNHNLSLKNWNCEKTFFLIYFWLIWFFRFRPGFVPGGPPGMCGPRLGLPLPPPPFLDFYGMPGGLDGNYRKVNFSLFSQGSLGRTRNWDHWTRRFGTNPKI